MGMSDTAVGRRSLLKGAAVGALSVAAGSVLAACGVSPSASGGSTSPSASGGSTSPSPSRLTSLQFGIWPGFGMEPQYEAYAAETGVTVTERLASWSQHHTNLETALGAGRGAPDVTTVESTYRDHFYAHPEYFVDLAKYGAKKDDFLDYLWTLGAAKDGTEVGVPLDAPAPVVLAYRRDIFEKAGLPADRASVQGLLPTWDALISVGRTIKEKTGLYLAVGSTALFTEIAQKNGLWYFDTDDQLILDSNADLTRAWEFATELAKYELTLNLAGDTDTVAANTALAQGTYALHVLPSWDKITIESGAPDASGLWDVVPLPEGGGPVQGGTWLSVPSTTPDPETATAFVNWIASAEQQTIKFVNTGAWPGTPASYDDPRIKDYAPEYWNKAPLGQLWGEAAKTGKPVYVGEKGYTVNDVIVQALRHLGDVKGEGADEIWAQAVEDAERKISQ
jgi:cellobiose transport system substrate-binding protein